MANRVRAALSSIGPIEERAMFGSLGFMINGKLGLCVRKDNVMYKVGAATAEESVQSASAKPVVMRNRVMKAWVYVNNNDLSEAADFEKWLALALDFNKL